MVNPKVNEIMSLVNSLTSVEEVHQVNDMVVAKIRAINSMRNQMGQYTFQVGDAVKWQSGKRGRGEMRGELIKKNRTRAVVRVEGTSGTWAVPFNMLEKVEADG